MPTMPIGDGMTVRMATGALALALAIAAPSCYAQAMHAKVAGSVLAGKVELTAGPHQQVASGEAVDTLVYFVPAAGGAPARPGQYMMYTHDRDFMPEAMAVPLGSTITFINQDDVPHNVYSDTKSEVFNVGSQNPGDRTAEVFREPGLVMINCRLHKSMESNLMVYPGAYATKAAADGSFALNNVPAGPGTLFFWNPRGTLTGMSVTMPITAPVHQALVVLRPRVLAEINVDD
jgi:plastocyanin